MKKEIMVAAAAATAAARRDFFHFHHINNSIHVFYDCGFISFHFIPFHRFDIPFPFQVWFRLLSLATLFCAAVLIAQNRKLYRW